MKPWHIFSLSLAGLLILGLLIFRAAFVTFVDYHEFGYQYDTSTGIISAVVDENGRVKTGYVIASPLVRVHVIDLRPMQICISANSRVLNCKLVKFNPKGFETFVSWHGRGDYSAVALQPILMSYAYDETGTVYPFLDIEKGQEATSPNNTSIKSDTITIK